MSQTHRKKPAAIVDDEPTVNKVVKQVSIMHADNMDELEVLINDFLPKLNYNDLTEPAIELYYFNGIYYAKAEFDVKIKDAKTK